MSHPSPTIPHTSTSEHVSSAVRFFESVASEAGMTLAMATMDAAMAPFSIPSATGKRATRLAKRMRLVEGQSGDHIQSKHDETSVFYHCSEVRDSILEGYEQCCDVAEQVQGTALQLQSLYNENPDPTDKEKAAKRVMLTLKRDKDLTELYKMAEPAWLEYEKLSDSSIMKTVKTPQEENELVLAHTEAFLGYPYAGRHTIRRDTERRFKKAMKARYETLASASTSGHMSSVNMNSGMPNEKGRRERAQTEEGDSINLNKEEASARELI